VHARKKIGERGDSYTITCSGGPGEKKGQVDREKGRKGEVIMGGKTYFNITNQKVKNKKKWGFEKSGEKKKMHRVDPHRFERLNGGFGKKGENLHMVMA